MIEPDSAGLWDDYRFIVPTIKDIARECGVSKNTVSSVLNNKVGEVSESTRDRILEAMRRLGYRRSAFALGLSGKTLNTIGIADRYQDSISETDPYKSAVLEGIIFTARRNRWDVLYYSGKPGEEQISSFPAYLDGRCDGLICFTGSMEAEVGQVIVETGLPAVFIGAPPFPGEVATVDVDNEGGAYAAVTHLIGLGHTRVAMIQSASTAGNASRYAGYRRAMIDGGLTPDDTLLYSSQVVDSYHTYTVGLEMLSKPAGERPTAVFCFCDTMALSILKAAAELKVAIPLELSIVGFDDIGPASQSVPPLTTVRQPFHRIGARAVTVLLGIIANETARNYSEALPYELVVRTSTGRPS